MTASENDVICTIDSICKSFNDTVAIGIACTVISNVLDKHYEKVASKLRYPKKAAAAVDTYSDLLNSVSELCALHETYIDAYDRRIDELEAAK